MITKQLDEYSQHNEYCSRIIYLNTWKRLNWSLSDPPPPNRTKVVAQWTFKKWSQVISPAMGIKEITVKNNDIQRTNSIIYYSALNLVDKKRCKHEIVKPPSASWKISSTWRRLDRIAALDFDAVIIDFLNYVQTLIFQTWVQLRFQLIVQKRKEKALKYAKKRKSN